MSPIDDELRTALSSRTDALRPSPDLFAGVERRAKRMRRQRVAATVAGSALAVSALGLGGPLLASSLTSTAPGPLDSAASAPAVEPFALDPARPWPYRGEEVLFSTAGSLAGEAWARRHGVPEGTQTFTPLYGELADDDAVLVFVAQEPAGDPFWGVVRTGPSGAEFLIDTNLTPSDRFGLAAALPGDPTPRLLVVAAPGTTVEHALPEQPLQPVTAIADGVGTAALDGDLDGDYFGVRAPDGRLLTQLGAPDPGPGPHPSTWEPADEVPAPPNALGWPTRGGVSADLLEQALTGFASSADVSRDEVGSHLLYAGERDGRVYVLLEGWYRGDARVYLWSYDTRDGSASSVLHGSTSRGAAVVAASLDGVLVVVPHPRAGQVLYSPDSRSAPRPVGDQGTDAAVLIGRAETTRGDRLVVLDGDGDLDRPLFDGRVDDLLGTTR